MISFWLAVALAAGFQPKPIATFHNCTEVGRGYTNLSNVESLTKTFKCDEGRIELTGGTIRILEDGYVYLFEMGEAMGDPDLITRPYYRGVKWCPAPKPWAERDRVACGYVPPTN